MRNKMPFLPKTKSPAYLTIGVVFLMMGILNFAGENGTSNVQTTAFNALYVVVGVIMIAGSRMIFYKSDKQDK